MNPYFVAFYTIAILVAASIFGALSGAFAAHKLTAGRESDAARAKRKRDLLRFLLRWQAEICVTDMPPAENFDRLYKSQIQEFHYLIAGMAGDFGSQAVEFVRLTSSFGGLMQGESGHHQMPKEILLKAIDELIRFINVA